MNQSTLSFIQLDRVIGAVIGSAVGDALGAGYEFATPPEPSMVTMKPGTLTGAPAGHWTDDTAMALGILRVLAAGHRLDDPAAVSLVADQFLDWFYSGPSDVGMHTSRVLSATTGPDDMAAAALWEQQRRPDSAGNGSLMRTGPVALTALGDDEAIAEAARAVSALTHAHQDAQDACVLWSIAIDRAIRNGSLEGPRAGLPLLSASQAEKWESWIDDAERRAPHTFRPNGYVVTALQAAWSAIVHSRGATNHFDAGLRLAISIGDDTDTVAAIAGALLGAAYGVTSVPFVWRHGLAGWPDGLRAIDLTTLAVRAARGGDDPDGWPSVASMASTYARFSPRGGTYVFEQDPGVVFGDFGALATTTTDAYLSLCRIGVDDRKVSDHEVVWLVDKPLNADAARVLADTADAIASLRAQGKTVFVHCVRAESRTPTVAMAWLIRHHALTCDDAIDLVLATITTAAPEGSLLDGVRQISSLATS